MKCLGFEVQEEIYPGSGDMRGTRYELIQEGNDLLVRESLTRNGHPIAGRNATLPLHQAVRILLQETGTRLDQKDSPSRTDDDDGS